MAPNMAKPTMKPVALEAEKTRLRKRCKGRMGSAARRSTRTKTVSRTTPSTAIIKIGAEPQA